MQQVELAGAFLNGGLDRMRHEDHTNTVFFEARIETRLVKGEVVTVSKAIQVGRWFLVQPQNKHAQPSSF